MPALSDFGIKQHLSPVRWLDFTGTQAASNWTDAGNTGTAAIEDAPAFAIGSTNAIKLSQTNTGGSYRSRWNLYNASGWNLSTADMFTLAVQYPANHLPSRHRVGSSGTIEIVWSSNGEELYTNNHLITLGGGGSFCGITEMGRNVWTWNLADMTPTSGGANMSAVTNIRITLNTASAVDEVYIQGLWYSRRPKSVVSIVFDDGWASAGLGASEACTIANAAGIPMTISVIPDLSEGSDGSTYLSEAEIAAIYAAGNSITVHGTGPSGVGSLVDYTDDGLAHVTEQQAWVRERGYDYEHYVYPGGTFNSGVLNVMQSLGFKTARTLAGTSYKATAWAANTAYSVTSPATYRVPTAQATAGATTVTPFPLMYEVTTGGTSHVTTEPTWPTTPGATVTDGTVTWTCRKQNYPSRISYYQFAPHINGPVDWLTLNACPLNNVLTLSQVLAEVDRAIKKGESIILYGHKLGGAADSLTFVTSDFTALCAALKADKEQGLCEVLTIPQMYDHFTTEKRPASGTRIARA